MIQIALLPGGEVAVQLQGPPSLFVVEGMLGAARMLLQRRIEQAAAAPQIVEAPAGLVVK